MTIHKPLLRLIEEVEQDYEQGLAAIAAEAVTVSDRTGESVFTLCREHYLAADLPGDPDHEERLRMGKMAAKRASRAQKARNDAKNASPSTDPTRPRRTRHAIRTTTAADLAEMAADDPAVAEKLSDAAELIMVTSAAAGALEDIQYCRANQLLSSAVAACERLNQYRLAHGDDEITSNDREAQEWQRLHSLLVTYTMEYGFLTTVSN